VEPTAKMLEWYNNLSFNGWIRFLNKNSKNPTLRRLQQMSLVDYSDMEQQIEDAPEPKVLKAGTEVEARIISVRTGTSDTNDCNWFTPVFDVPNDPMVMEFNDFFWELDKDKLTEKQLQRSMYKFKNFIQCFGIDISRPIDLVDSLPGHKGYIIVGLRKSEEFGEQNTVKKYIVRK